MPNGRQNCGYRPHKINCNGRRGAETPPYKGLSSEARCYF